jgi:arginine N-succinyltransferase
MSFIVRAVRSEDLNALFELAQQFSLLNLPADKKILAKKIELSLASFSGEVSKDQAVYVFVTEDLENKTLSGSAQIKAKHGTKDNPNYSFKVIRKERFSRDLGIGFIHQILRLDICEDGPTEIGGLVVNKHYRRRPEKIGRLTSLNRFLYIGMNIDKFEPNLIAEMAPPLTDEGRSEFWESLGRRFTGMPYQEADELSRQNKEFIRSLFPEEDIYLCLLDSQARLVMGRVGQETMPALHLLEKMGFKYLEQVDPFDGGPHIGVKTTEVKVIKKSKWRDLSDKSYGEFLGTGMFGAVVDDEYRSCASAYALDGEKLILPDAVKTKLGIESGIKIYCSEVG